ncbi:unnamed protein product [Clonostachys rhizophaga]|uniref:Uncharacterized protein n=1 Tax=Clonostachys rhizophaga TaxID=160324 RepID=A0A9N9YTN8_9HYPO|nr:unnamed protein product [Clonostachys rhizophaga]
MALVMSRCAAGMLALVARTSLPVIVAGYPPIQASAVTVDRWDYIWFILATIVCLQLVLSLVVVFTATRVVIPPEGAMSIAKVLHFMVLDKDPERKVLLLEA